jgi:hypothetical protein
MPSPCTKRFSSWLHASQRFWFCQCHRPHINSPKWACAISPHLRTKVS